MLPKCNYVRLFGKKPNFYKANLNCHTYISDGQLSPEEIKELYKRNGYSVVAFSDRDAMIAHKELNDKDFVALTATELVTEIDNGKKVSFSAIALDENNENQPLYHREKYFSDDTAPSRPLVKFDESLPDYEREPSIAGVNAMMKKCREDGFFVTLTAPRASRLTYDEYTALTEIDAMEIINYSSLLTGENDHNEQTYEDIVKKGDIRPYAIAADGNKNLFPEGYRACDSLGAYTMINAESLDYKSITEALKNGSFYSTEGPEIYDLWYRSEVLYVRCSPADKIIFETASTRKVVYAENGKLLDGEGICFWVMPEHLYVRVTIVDKYGRRAFTNAYSSDMLFNTFEKVD